MHHEPSYVSQYGSLKALIENELKWLNFDSQVSVETFAEAI
jgi:hypothetical protein